MEQANRLTLNQYMEKYVEDIKSGARSTYKGSNFSPNSTKTINSVANRIKEFQEEQGRVLGFEDIDMDFYRNFMAFMKSKSYNINTTGKIINLFKTMLACAEEDGYPVNPAFRYKSFKGQRVLVDTIYLTRQDVKKMMAVNLPKMDKIEREIADKQVWNRLSRQIPNAKRRSSYPGLKIGRLAVSKGLQGSGIGKKIINFIQPLFFDNRYAGCRFITVDALKTAEEFYRKCRFLPLNNPEPEEETILMFFDLKGITLRR